MLTRCLRASFGNFLTPLSRCRMVPSALNGTICYCLISEKLLILLRTRGKCVKSVRMSIPPTYSDSWKKIIWCHGRAEGNNDRWWWFFLFFSSSSLPIECHYRLLDGRRVILLDPPCCNTRTSVSEKCMWECSKTSLLCAKKQQQLTWDTWKSPEINETAFK